MSHFLSRIYESISIITDKAPLSADEKLRLQHYSVFLLLGAPTMLAFATVSLLRGDYPLGGSVAACVGGLFIGWSMIRRGLSAVVIYRINAGLFAALLIYLAAVGGQDGSKILWSYTFPLIAFFLFGRGEGWFWVAIMFALLGGILVMKETPVSLYEYSNEFRIRFLITFTMVSVFAFWFEYFRDDYRRQAERERKRLEHALAEVKALSGLLPICSSCKKIRDDKGYWNQLEGYIHAHTDARFSHGICPDCMHELYPEIEIAEEKDDAIE